MYFTNQINLYVCKTNPKISAHHGLHANTAPYVVTTDPEPGDVIVYRLAGACTQDFENGERVSARATLTCWHNETQIVRLISHAGRNATLGEDGLESAFGEDITEELFIESLPLGRDRGQWGYAPVDVKVYDAKPMTSKERVSLAILNFELGEDLYWE